MIIVSQDKRKLIPMDAVSIDELPSYENAMPVYRYEVWVNRYGSNYLVGRYNSEKKVDKVFQEIMDAVHHCNDIYVMPQE